MPKGTSGVRVVHRADSEITSTLSVDGGRPYEPHTMVKVPSKSPQPTPEPGSQPQRVDAHGYSHTFVNPPPATAPRLSRSPVEPQDRRSMPPTQMLNPLHAMFAGLSRTFQELEARTTHTLHLYERERKKWRDHCLTFKNERDAARQKYEHLKQQYILLCQDRVNLISQASQSPTSESPSESHPAMHRKDKRQTRRHSPYHRSVSPSSPSSLTSPVFDSPPQSRPSMTTPFRGLERSASLPPILGNRPAAQRLVHSHRTIPGSHPLAFVECSVAKWPDDSTPFDVTCIYTPPRRMEIERFVGRSSDPKAEYEKVETDRKGDKSSEVSSRTLIPEQARLIYAPAHGQLWCRMCIYDREKMASGSSCVRHLKGPSVSRFPTTTTWEELTDHALSRHPDHCQSLFEFAPRGISDLAKLGLSSH